tara:strand:+ start:219 stop:1109 length:891 start_codon:yes stop_codon:yes gene_type:complete
MANADNLFVRETLTKEKVGLTTINQRLETSIGIGTTRPPTFREAIEDIDLLMLDRIIAINDDKRTIGAAYTDLYNSTNCGLATNATRFTATLNSDIDDHIYRGGIEIVSQDRGDGITTNIARAPLYADMLRAFQFDDLEDGNSIGQDPRADTSYVTISPSNNLGVGVTAYLAENGRIVNNNGNGGSIHNAVDVSAGSARIGYIYAYDNTNNTTYYTGGGTCNSFDNNFESLTDDINDERRGASGITTFSNGSSNIRDKRVKELISIWSYQWQMRTNDDKIDEIDDALDAMDQLPPF